MIILEYIKLSIEEVPIVLFLLYICFAASIGSFLGCCYYRIPRKISLFEPKRSFCPKCDYQLKFLDLIPILSYVFLRGKCRNCKAGISPTYFIIEISTVFLFCLVLLYIF